MAKFRPVRCSECDTVYGNPGALRIHSLCHNSTAPFKCSECSFAVKNPCSLKMHMQRAHPNAFSSYNTPKRSVKKKTPKKVSGKLAVTDGYICKDCGWISAGQFNFNRHAACHTGNFTFRCLLCSFGSSSSRHIMYHGNKAHPGQKVLPDMAVNAKPLSKKKKTKKGLEPSGLDYGEPATAMPHVSDNLRKRRFHCKLRVPKNVRAKQTRREASPIQRREASETSQTVEETTPPAETGTGVHTAAAGDGPTSSGAGTGAAGRSSEDLPPALQLMALLAQRAAINVNLAQVDQQIKNLEYVELIKTLPIP